MPAQERLSAAELEGLLPYCTESQRPKIEALIAKGSLSRAANALEIHQRNVERTLKAVRERAALQGFSPEHGLVYPAPMGTTWNGVSIYHQATPTTPAQWVKFGKDDALRRAVMDSIFEAFIDDLPRVKPAKAIAAKPAEYLNLYTFTDGHVGAYAWKEEGGAAWDLEIAEHTYVSGGIHLMRTSPKAKTGVLSFQGDWLHYDGMLPVTPTHGHVLDAAGRPGQVITVAIRICRRLIDEALKYHEVVRVVVSEGNHDLIASLWLRRLLTIAYENESRVQVEQHESPFHAFHFGLNMIGFHHGHTRKKERLSATFAARFRKIWGATVYREIHTGHLHHESVIEEEGVTINQHKTGAAADAHSSRHGYHSERAIDCITYHERFGKENTKIFRPEMLEAA